MKRDKKSRDAIEPYVHTFLNGCLFGFLAVLVLSLAGFIFVFDAQLTFDPLARTD